MELCHSAQYNNGPVKWHSQVHFHLRITSILHPIQSIASFTEHVLCFLLLQHFITLHLFSVKGGIGVSCTDVQHLQIGQVCEGALVHRVHRQPVKPKERQCSWGLFSHWGFRTQKAKHPNVQERWLTDSRWHLQITSVRRIRHLRDPYRGTHLLSMYATLYCNHTYVLSVRCFTQFTWKHFWNTWNLLPLTNH